MIDQSSLNILVVDDELLILRLHKRLLMNLGFASVTTCEGALAALEVIDLAHTLPDLILLDLNMPEMDGVEFLRYLAKRNYDGSLILVSGEDSRILQTAEKLAAAHQMTTLGYLSKPINPESLATLLFDWRAALTEHWSPLKQSRTAKPEIFYSADDVRAAIVNRELVNFYQPKVSLTTGHVVGVEALVRWQHPVDGLVFPDRFINVAEAHGLIRPLTRLVIANALTQARCWQVEQGLALQVAINVSMDDLGSLDFVDYVVGEANTAGVQAQDVTLEVTESRLFQDIRFPLEVLSRLRLKRFRLSIDDFGTGHSSLAQLRDLPFNEMKIDRGFVHRAWADETVSKIFKTSQLLAKQMNVEIVAEGIEDRADWDYVVGAKCEVAQGYFIAKPMPADELRNWLEEWEERSLPVA